MVWDAKLTLVDLSGLKAYDRGSANTYRTGFRGRSMF